MALNRKPFVYNWATCTAGDTYPALNIVETSASTTADLSRVRIKIKDSAGATFTTLDSDASGITINTTTAAAWDWTIDTLTAPTTAGIYKLDMEWTDSAGDVFTAITGQWEILTQETD